MFFMSISVALLCVTPVGITTDDNISIQQHRGIYISINCNLIDILIGSNKDIITTATEIGHKGLIVSNSFSFGIRYISKIIRLRLPC